VKTTSIDKNVFGLMYIMTRGLDIVHLFTSGEHNRLWSRLELMKLWRLPIEF